jgi:hypothetical protein
MLIRALTIHAAIPFFFTFFPYLTRPLSMMGLFALNSDYRAISLLILNASTVLNNALTIYSIKPYRQYIITTTKKLAKRKIGVNNGIIVVASAN